MVEQTVLWLQMNTWTIFLYWLRLFSHTRSTRFVCSFSELQPWYQIQSGLHMDYTNAITSSRLPNQHGRHIIKGKWTSFSIILYFHLTHVCGTLNSALTIEIDYVSKLLSTNRNQQITAHLPIHPVSPSLQDHNFDIRSPSRAASKCRAESTSGFIL